MKSIIFGLTLCLLGVPVWGQVNNINVAFAPAYSQTTDNTLGPVTSSNVSFTLFTNGVNDLSAVTVTPPSSSTLSLVQGAYGQPGSYWSAQTTLPSANGTYVFQTTGNGSISSQTVDVMASGSFPTSLFLTGTSIETLEAATGSSSVNLTLNYYSVSVSPTWLIFDQTTGSVVGQAALTSTSFAIPGSDIKPGDAEVLELIDSNSTNALVNSIPTSVQYNPFTVIAFGATATPEPSVFVLLLGAFAGGLAFSVVKKARMRVAKIA